MKIKNLSKKIISALLIVVMIATCAPVMGFASDEEVNSVSKVTYITNTVSGVKICFSAVEDAKSYDVYRSAAGEDFVKIGSSNSTTYIDKTAENGVMYTYYAKANMEEFLLVTSGEESIDDVSKSILFVATPEFTVENSDIGPVVEITPVDGTVYYGIKRCDEGETTYKTIGTIDGDASDLSFTDIDVENGKSYKYAVGAVAYSGNSYYYSSELVVELAEAMTEENATDITYITNNNEGVKLCLKKVDNAESYTIYRMSEKESYKAIAVTSSTTYVDKTVENNVLYTYRVAVTGYYFSENAHQIRFIETPEFTVNNAGTGVCVDFTPVEGADKYVIRRRDTTTNTFTCIGVVDAADDSLFYDMNVENDTTYVYAVGAVSGKYLSYYNTVKFTTFLTPNVVLSNVQTGMKVAYTKCEGAVKYTFYRRTDDTDWEVINSIKPATYFYIIDKTAISGVKYYYAVKVDTADNSTGHDPYGSSLKYLESPTLFLSNDETSVTVDFTSSTGATNYKIYRKVNNKGSLVCIGMTDADTLTFVDTNVVEGETYTYAVRAIDGNLMSYYKSSTISVAVFSFDDAIVDDFADVDFSDELVVEEVIAEDITVEDIAAVVDEDALTAIEFGELNITEDDVVDVIDDAAATSSGIIDLLEDFISNLPIENTQIFTKLLEVLNAFIGFFSNVVNIVAL